MLFMETISAAIARMLYVMLLSRNIAMHGVILHGISW